MEIRRSESVKVVAIIIARNEEENIPKVIDSLKQQTIGLDKIIVVNDGSTDNTGEIARRMGCSVLDLAYHEESFLGRPELAERLNAGLKLIEKHNQDYVLKLDADHTIPKDYVERIIDRMEKNPKLVVASGCIKGEPYSEFDPRGSGRIIKASWLREEFGGLRFPVCWGWEAYLLLKALKSGYEVKCFREVESEIKRRTGLGKAGYWGKAMYALGYDWKYALGRCFLTFLNSPRAGLSMFWGWFRHKGIKRSDLAEWLNRKQKREFWEKVLKIIKRKGRG
ncbi:MAG: glycosyltransferase family A protein [Candidatus Bathyarchaeia archaeon]